MNYKHGTETEKTNGQQRQKMYRIRIVRSESSLSAFWIKKNRNRNTIEKNEPQREETYTF